MKKRLILLAVILIVSAFILVRAFEMPGEMDGGVSFDPKLVNDENFNILADNWEKIAQDASEPTPCEGTDWIRMHLTNADAFVMVYVNMGDADARNPFEMLFTPRYYKADPDSGSVSAIVLGNQRIVIMYTENEAGSGPEKFENWFRVLLESVQAEE